MQTCKCIHEGMVSMCGCACTQTFIRTHACLHTYTHACMYTRMHTYTHALMHACTHTHTHACTHACTHTHTHACTHARTHAHTRDLTTNPPLRSIQPLVKHKLGSEEYKVSGNVSGPGGGKSSEIACQTILPVYHLDNIPTQPVHAGSFNEKYVQCV